MEGSPQMTPEEIKKMFSQLVSDNLVKESEEAYAKVRDTLRAAGAKMSMEDLVKSLGLHGKHAEEDFYTEYDDDIFKFTEAARLYTVMAKYVVTTRYRYVAKLVAAFRASKGTPGKKKKKPRMKVKLNEVKLNKLDSVFGTVPAGTLFRNLVMNTHKISVRQEHVIDYMFGQINKQLIHYEHRFNDQVERTDKLAYMYDQLGNQLALTQNTLEDAYDNIRMLKNKVQHLEAEVRQPRSKANPGKPSAEARPAGNYKDTQKKFTPKSGESTVPEPPPQPTTSNTVKFPEPSNKMRRALTKYIHQNNERCQAAGVTSIDDILNCNNKHALRIYKTANSLVDQAKILGMVERLINQIAFDNDAE